MASTSLQDQALGSVKELLSREFLDPKKQSDVKEAKKLLAGKGILLPRKAVRRLMTKAQRKQRRNNSPPSLRDNDPPCVRRIS